MIAKCYKTWIVGCVLAMFTLGGLSSAQQTAATAPPAETTAQQPKTPPVLTGIEYVDIRNGFSFLPPAGALPYGTDRVHHGHLAKGCKSVIHLLPDMTTWEAVKKPASNNLMRFIQPAQPDTILNVALLVAKENSSIEQTLESRSLLWKRTPEKAMVQQTQTTIINDHKAGTLTLTWKENTEAENFSHIIRETIIQNENDRYFLLTLISKDGTAEERLASETLMKTISDSFKCLGKAQEDRRWKQARTASQTLLSGLNAEKITPLLQPEFWMTVTADDKTIGIGQMTQTIQGEEKTISTQLNFVIDNEMNARDFAAAFGFLAALTPEQKPAPQSKEEPITPTRIRCKSTIPATLKSETFDLQFIASENLHKGYRLHVDWQDKQLTTKLYDTPQETEKVISEKLEVNTDIYLPWTTASVLGRIADKKPGLEYVFMTWYNRSLCYYCLRVVKQNESVVIGDHAYNSTYLIGQAGTLGPIVEFWIDDMGQLVKMRASGITVQRGTKEIITTQYPDRVTALDK